MDLLDIKNLTITLKADRRRELVRGASLSVGPERIVGLVGGSGSGKTSTGLAVLRLLPEQLEVSAGEICFEGENLLAWPEQRLRRLRGGRVAMVFQEPLTAFNPVFPIGAQIEECLQYHTSLSAAARTGRVLELLDTVGIDEPRRVAASYAHQLSGGMRQRAMIAQALSAGPRLLIADEPTSNLDVTLQARILELFDSLRKTLKISILLITHDLGVVGHLCDELAVMAEGRIIETGPAVRVMKDPQQEYTRRLMKVLEE